MTLRPVHVVWFKRDLRTADHAPLVRAMAAGRVLPLYVVEPDLWRQPDVSGRQYAFLKECLADLNRDLGDLGLSLTVRVGLFTDVLDKIADAHPIAGLWSHEETGNGWTFARDKHVASWCRQRGVTWTEIPQNGVVRRLPTRTGWAKRWEQFMGQDLVMPQRSAHGIEIESHIIPDAASLGLASDPCPGRQTGGRRAGEALLQSFLEERGRDYRFSMSSPVSAVEACSRLSPHLAFGTLSMREVAQATRAQLAVLAPRRDADGIAWKKSLVSFIARLHWHCHFMQKLESEPRIEFTNLHKAYDGMRETVDRARLEAWARGQTGFPFVDACMRSLIATGWINFRMRAMLMSFASYHLWLPWRDTGLHLARLFTDYEAGIHWPQTQMQSGTTGINTIRMYNPVKQGYDQDPTGAFVRHWVPELAELPPEATHEPWLFPEALGGLARTYPVRIVDHIEAAKEARAKVWGVRGARTFRDQADAIQHQHGSRKSGMPMTGQRPQSKAGRKPKKPAPDASRSQFEFDL